MRKIINFITIILVSTFGFSLGSSTLSSLSLAVVGAIGTYFVMSFMFGVENQIDNLFNNSHIRITYSEDNK